MKPSFLLIPVIMSLVSACNHTPAAADDAAADSVVTPVTVAAAGFGPVSDSLELTATSAYLQNNYIKAVTTGFVRSVLVKPGDYVEAGKPLFTLETKESTIIGDRISQLDSTFKFSGQLQVRARGHGYVTQLNHQPGDYVQDGEQLAVISDRGSFVFLLNMPYEVRRIVLGAKSVTLSLPDGTRLPGTIGTVFPTVDSVTQTQTVVIRVNPAFTIPQNLIARVHILREIKNHAQTLPRSALLTNETQSEFWVMKLIDSGTAVKIPVKKGLEFPDRIEVTEPVFDSSDRILVSGNYGLPDTAKVIQEKP